ncbi:glycosyltransferase [bacterium]|nr:glycosyltransferase [bacterium]
MKKPRVFMVLTEISGHYSSLKKGFNELGIICTFINLSDNRYAYSGADKSWIADKIRYYKRLKNSTGRLNLPMKVFYATAVFLLKSALFCWALSCHDIFIFGFNSSFFHLKDLPVIKLLGKKIIYQFHGSDSRPPYLDGSLIMEGETFNTFSCIKQTRKKKRIIATIDRYADAIIDTPAQGHFHNRPFVNWMYIGLPNRPDNAPDILIPPDKQPDRRLEHPVSLRKSPDTILPPDEQPDSPVRILHCPSHPEAKGTPLIRQVIKDLISKGFKLEFIEVAGKPNSVVIGEMKRCDIVIDQLFADYGMPGLATEAAWFGKPVVICGYAVELWEKILSPQDRPPTLYVDVKQFPNALEKIITDKEYRRELGRLAGDFVRNKWHPAKIAQRYLMIADGFIPPQWMYNPAEISYIHGCCVEESKLKTMIRQVIETGGVQALQLDEKPILAKRIAEFSAGIHDLAIATKNKN